VTSVRDSGSTKGAVSDVSAQLVRGVREESSWLASDGFDVIRSGSAAVAEKANVDTFHYTVCAPQTAILNQSKISLLGLEDYYWGMPVSTAAAVGALRLRLRRGRSGVSGRGDPAPVLQNRGLGTRFKLAATGYVLDQTPSLGPILTRPARVDTTR
jgi:endonuclease G